MAALLEGLHVLELGDGVAGGAAAAALAELGAHVTRLTGGQAPDQPPRIRSDLDRLKVVTADAGAALAQAWHVVIDDCVATGKAGDVAAELTTPPQVIVTITGFGLDGSNEGWVASEFVALAAGGGMAGVHDAQGRPVPTAGWQALLSTGAVAALAALDGLNVFREQGATSPVEVDVAARDAVIFTFTYLDCAHHLMNCPGSAGGKRYTAPTGVFPTRDGHLRLAAVDDHQWNGAKAAFGHPAWAEKYQSVEDRRDHAEALSAEVEAWTRTRAKGEVAQLLQANGVPATPVNTGPEVMAAPHLWDRGFFRSDQGTVRHRDAFAVTGPASGDPRADEKNLRGHWDRCLGPTLSDLLLVEATHVISAPIAGSLLGALGSRVVRLEDVDRIDMYRRIGPWADGEPGVEQGAYFLAANMNKESLAFSVPDLTDVAEILAQADLVLENVRGSRLRRWQVDLDELRRDDKLTISVSGFGRTGPLAEYRAYANNIHAYAGLTDSTRTVDGEYAQVYTVLADICTSLATALVAASWGLGPRSGTAADADIAMLEVMVARLIDVLTGPPADGQNFSEWCAREAGAAPNDVLPTGDGDFVAITVRDDREWEVLAEHVGASSRWALRETRLTDAEALHRELVERLASHGAEDLARHLQANGVPAARVVGPQQTCHDPVLHARGVFREVPHEERGSYVVLCQPWRVPEHRTGRWRGAPVLGSRRDPAATTLPGDRPTPKDGRPLNLRVPQ
jgi:crotonobetainyl-CoA:carnitine CoA-transferase CaiB-like acyl-CoA transferase